MRSHHHTSSDAASATAAVLSR